MTFNQLRAFLTAARLGTFTAAAQELQLAQASVSELVRRLEDECGLPVFTRAGRRLTLTAAGKELVPFAEQALTAVDNAGSCLRAVRGLSVGTATLGVMRNAEYYLLPDLAEAILSRYPGLRIKLKGQNSVEVAAAVATGELEAGLVILPVDNVGLDIRPLMREEIFLATANPDSFNGLATIEDIATTRLILYDAHYGWTDPTRRQLAEQAQLAGYSLNPVIEVEQATSALSLAARGAGDTIVSRTVADALGFSNEIVLIPFAVPIYDTFASVRRHGVTPSPATSRVLELAEKTLRSRGGIHGAPNRPG